MSVIELPRSLGTRRIHGTPCTCAEAGSLRFGLDILTARAVPRRVLLTEVLPATMRFPAAPPPPLVFIHLGETYSQRSLGVPLRRAWEAALDAEEALRTRAEGWNHLIPCVWNASGGVAAACPFHSLPHAASAIVAPE